MGESPAVTLSVSKRKGTNAVVVAEHALAKVESLKGTLIPSGVDVTVTRDYGETAQEKSNEFLQHLLLATLSVTFSSPWHSAGVRPWWCWPPCPSLWR